MYIPFFFILFPMLSNNKFKISLLQIALNVVSKAIGNNFFYLPLTFFVHLEPQDFFAKILFIADRALSNNCGM